MLHSEHWNDPRNGRLIDPVMLSLVLARREDRLMLLEGAPSGESPGILRFLERMDSGKKLSLSADDFRTLLWEYINFPKQAMKRLSGLQTLYIDNLDTVIPVICKPLTDSFIDFFEALDSETAIIATTQSRPHHILRQFYYYGFDYCIFRFVL